MGRFVHVYLRDDLGRGARWLTGLLVLQFVLGMAANLFQKIPDDKPWMVFHELGPISLHTINALLILTLAVWLRVLAGRKRQFVVPVAVGGTAAAIAFVCGTIFVNLGQNDIFSYVMALGFIVALLEFAYIGFRMFKR